MQETTASLIVIRAAAIEAALAFYQALGLSFTPEQHGSGPQHYSCALGDLIFEIYPLQSGAPEFTDSTMLGFHVASLDETLAALHKLGIEPKFPPKTAEWGRFVNLSDPDGRTVQLTEKPCK